jgi:hypothetical protein
MIWMYVLQETGVLAMVLPLLIALLVFTVLQVPSSNMILPVLSVKLPQLETLP